MTLTADLRTDAAAPCPPTPVDTAAALLAAAERLLPGLERGRAIDAGTLRAAMTAAFGGSDAEGVWSWKLAYDAGEAAQVLFLRRFGPAMLARSASPAAFLAMLERLAALLPSQTRRSEESQARQQFSTPLPLAGVVAAAAALTPADQVLEPSAGTGLLAVFAEQAGAGLALNELADTRAGLLEGLFPGVPVTRFDAANIHDHLDAAVRPTVVLMNPPFSALAAVDGRVADAAVRHLASALARLAEGGRLVAVTGAGLAPEHPAWRDAFVRLQEQGRVVFSAAIDGKVYARHGTTVDTGLTVIDRVPAEDPAVLPASPGMAPDAATLLEWVRRDVPPRASVSASAATPLPVLARAMVARPVRRVAAVPTVCTPASGPAVVELVYEPRDWTPETGARLTAALYEPYALQSIVLPGARPHPTPLVQSAAMAAVAPPKPRYRPHLPATLVTGGVLSDAQLESVILAGEAHAGHLAGSWTVDDTFDVVSAAPDDAADAVRFRRGWFLGDGTGAGKGRQVAGILLDNWLKGRQRALWISKSDTLIEDARRDWSALGQEPLLITPLSRFRPGTPITLERGVLFTTYATLRGEGGEGAVPRVRQIVDWLGRDFDGVIVFDESHALRNAGGTAGFGRDGGPVTPSQQGRAGLRLQHALPDARVLYVSATGATTVHNLAYAQRLGLWGGADFPFASRAEFVQAIEAGGVAAMEVLARDLKALGLYSARSLSFEGVRYEMVEHRLTPGQVAIYDAYGAAFQVIHTNLTAALEAVNVTGAGGTLNRVAKAAARSAFVRDRLERREGLAMVVLDSTDAPADAAAFARTGIGRFEPFHFERKGRRPDGRETVVAFSLAFALDPRLPDTAFFVCQQHHPENFWNPAFQQHPNGALDVGSVTLEVPDPSEHADFLAGFTGSVGRPGGERGLVFPLRGGGRLIVASGAGASGGTSYRVATADPAAVAERLRRRNMPFRTDGDAVTVGPAEAFGVAIQFGTAGTR